MRHGVSGHSLSMLGAFALLLGTIACGDDGGGGGSASVGDLATECERYCNNQGDCPNDPTPASCRDACQSLGEMFPACVEEWNALNHCMAEDDLVCDSMGYSATRGCVNLGDAFGACLGG